MFEFVLKHSVIVEKLQLDELFKEFINNKYDLIMNSNTPSSSFDKNANFNNNERTIREKTINKFSEALLSKIILK